MQYFFQSLLLLTQQSPPSKLHSGVLNSSSQYLSWYQDGFSAIASQMAGAAVGGAAAVVGAAVVGAAVVATDPPQAVGAARSDSISIFPICYFYPIRTCHTPVVASNLVVSCQVVSFAACRPFSRSIAIAHQTLPITGTTLPSILVIKIMKHSHVVSHLMSNNLSNVTLI